MGAVPPRDVVVANDPEWIWARELVGTQLSGGCIRAVDTSVFASGA
jgi:hypothetical protein